MCKLKKKISTIHFIRESGWGYEYRMPDWISSMKNMVMADGVLNDVMWWECFWCSMQHDVMWRITLYIWTTLNCYLLINFSHVLFLSPHSLTVCVCAFNVPYVISHFHQHHSNMSIITVIIISISNLTFETIHLKDERQPLEINVYKHVYVSALFLPLYECMTVCLSVKVCKLLSSYAH